jgi:hypothetical protein
MMRSFKRMELPPGASAAIDRDQPRDAKRSGGDGDGSGPLLSAVEVGFNHPFEMSLQPRLTL